MVVNLMSQQSICFLIIFFDVFIMSIYIIVFLKTLFIHIALGNLQFGFICFHTSILVFFLVRCIMMASKDDLDDCDIIKQGLMVKRSQNKKRFIPINYKQRWFVLTTKNFIYYESESEVSRQLSILMVLIEVLSTIYN